MSPEQLTDVVNPLGLGAGQDRLVVVGILGYVGDTVWDKSIERSVLHHRFRVFLGGRLSFLGFSLRLNGED